MKISERKLEKILYQVGKSIKNEPVEYGAVINSNTGVLQLCRRGKEYEVPLNKKEEASLRNMVFLHNHPGESPVSGGDVAAAFQHKLNRLIVITKKHFISMKIPENFNSRTLPKSFVAEVNQVCKNYFGSKKSIQKLPFIRKYINYCKIQENRLEREVSKSGKDRTVQNFWGDVWKRFAEGIPGCEYKKKRIKSGKNS